MGNLLSEVHPELVSEWSNKICRLHRIRLHTAQTKYRNKVVTNISNVNMRCLQQRLVPNTIMVTTERKVVIHNAE